MCFLQLLLHVGEGEFGNREKQKQPLFVRESSEEIWKEIEGIPEWVKHLFQGISNSQKTQKKRLKKSQSCATQATI